MEYMEYIEMQLRVYLSLQRNDVGYVQLLYNTDGQQSHTRASIPTRPMMRFLLFQSFFPLSEYFRVSEYFPKFSQKLLD